MLSGGGGSLNIEAYFFPIKVFILLYDTTNNMTEFMTILNCDSTNRVLICYSYSYF